MALFADFCAGVRECSLLDLTLVGSGAGDANRAAQSRRALGFELPLAEFGEGDSQRTWA